MSSYLIIQLTREIWDRRANATLPPLYLLYSITDFVKTIYSKTSEFSELFKIQTISKNAVLYERAECVLGA